MKKIAVTAAAAALALSAGAAFAHTSIAESDPADNSTIEALPEEVSIRFGNAQIPAPQPMQLQDATLTLLDPCGVRADNGDAAWDDTTSTLAATVKPAEKAGRYEIQWSGTSTDGDAQAGFVDFVVSGGSECASVVRADAAGDVDVGFDPTKIVSKAAGSGAAVTITLAGAPVCKSFKTATGQLLNVEIDTSWDEGVDYSGSFTCRAKKIRRNGVVRRVPVYGVAVTKAGAETPSLRLKVRKTGRKALTVTVPGSIVEDADGGSLDLYVSSTTESDQCGQDTTCADRAPDLGWVRSL